MSIENMCAEELEHQRRKGFIARRALSESVIADLIIPNGWHAAAEYQQEFGGLYPVQVRFWPSHGRFSLVLCSPGAVSSHWKMLLISGSAQRVELLRQFQKYCFTQISNVLIRTNQLDRDGYIFDGIAGSFRT
ncbi:conjugation system SOS inhibitor PsiB [Pseudocitrobacter faecalis]|uniref:Conjugation system SOS inhibitor PsiB n=1 Tax=Salmonella enterica TaxID=28901 RepID=A0A5U3R486_SALER|nr:conjugation system SOS inhibitor PsiB [Salmonella enterica]EBP6409655.1 conjugation system SOS inhibitor PsiB [Salmonella enterica]EBP7111270.1 conjugation system SOS inhibitor PsiB [Salmonella enterica]